MGKHGKAQMVGACTKLVTGKAGGSEAYEVLYVRFGRRLSKG